MSFLSPSPVYGYLDSPSMIDFPGNLAAVFFTSGCNFKCGFCHNSELIKNHGKHLSWEELDAGCSNFTLNWVDAAVITGGEPTLCPGLEELIIFLKNKGWRVKLDTNGSKPETLEKIIPYVDYIAMDVKTSLKQYKSLTSYSDTDNIRQAIKLIINEAADYEFRTTIIKPFHTPEVMQDIGRTIENAKRYILQPFVPKPGLPDKSLEQIPRTSPDYMLELSELVADFTEQVNIRGD